MISFIKGIEMSLRKKAHCFKSDNGIKFKNQSIESCLKNLDISHNFYVANTLQQNGVVEKRNQSFYEAARTMLIYANLPQYFGTKALSTTCFT